VTRPTRYLVGLAILAAACTDNVESPLEPTALEPTADLSSSGASVRVTTKADDGAGSFRQAVLKANTDPSIGTIRFDRGLGPIRLFQPIVYSGNQALVIRGEAARLDGVELAAGASALVAEGGGDLTIAELTVVRAPGNGITIKVPDLATGVLRIRLHEVTIRENGLHGVLINDQAEYLIDPASESEAGSAASLLVEVTDSRFERNGFALIDSDGLRVNEGGEGSLEANVRGTRFANNGADGLELDERSVGDAKFALRHTTLIGNGSFTSEDLDDGIDVDEGGDGDLIGRFNDVVASRNFEQGVDLNENGMGDLRVFMADVLAAENNQEGIEFEEDDDVAGGGDIEAELVRVTARRNGGAGGDAGLKLREKGDGDLVARLVEAVSVDNRLLSGDDPVSGILLREDEEGDLTAELVQAIARRNGGDGIALEENEDGDLDGQIRRSTASSNDGAGANLTQEPTGTGQVRLVHFTAPGNGGGPILDDGVVVTGTP
jgi:hypothetical protein